MRRDGASTILLPAGARVWEWCPHMEERIADRSSIATLVALIPSALLASAFLASAFLAGCASTGDNPLTLFADPGKYQYSSCEQLAGQRKSLSTREQELRLLMDRAEQ